MDINSAFPSKFIKAADLQGQDVTVSIARFAMESVDDDAGELKPVLYFQGHQRGLVLNKTNALSISDLYGTETDTWLNQPVTLFPTQCQYGPKMVDCIRVRPFSPAQQNGQPQPLAAPAASSVPAMSDRPSSPPPMTAAPPQPFGQPQPAPPQPASNAVQF